jgi:hypothetical protein
MPQYMIGVAGIVQIATLQGTNLLGIANFTVVA